MMSGDTPLWRSDCPCASSVSRRGCSSSDFSAIPKSVVSAVSGPANNPTRSIAVCAEGVPSLQSKIFMLEFVARHKRVDNDCRTDQRQRHKSEADLRAREILRSDHADLRPDHCARVHDERDQNIYIALDGVSKRSVTR